MSKDDHQATAQSEESGEDTGSESKNTDKGDLNMEDLEVQSNVPFEEASDSQQDESNIAGPTQGQKGEKSGAEYQQSKWSSLPKPKDSDDANKEGEDKRYGKEARNEVDRILQWDAKAFYEILDVEEKSSTNIIKDSYQKIILKIHPDKNKFKGAKRAFESKSQKWAHCFSYWHAF